MRGWLRPIAEHLVGVALIAVAVAPWLRIAAPDDARIAVLGAVALATVVALVTTRVASLRMGPELAASSVVLLAFLLIVVVRDPFGVVEVARGLRDGIPRILSTTLPILDVRWAVVPAGVVAWAAAGVATSAIARTRSVALPVGAAFAAFLSGYVLMLGGASDDPATSGLGAVPALMVLACLLAALRSDGNVRSGPRRRAFVRAAAATAIVSVSVVVALVAVEHAPYAVTDPVEPRLVPEAATREPTSPTLATRLLRGDDVDRVVGHVTVDADWSGYVSIAALQDYDGRIWSIGRDRFDPTGGTLPVEVPVGGGTVVAFEQVDLQATGGWLPYIARATSVEGVSVLHNGGGALQPAEPRADAGYRMWSAQPSLTLADEVVGDDARVATGGATSIGVPVSMSDRRPAGQRVCRFLSLSRDGTATPNIDGVECGGRAPRDVGFLRAMSSALRDGRAVQEDIVGGDQLESGSEALYDLLELVGASRGDAAVGTPEQFASAFALMADDFDIPVRVVTGFRLQEPAVGESQAIRGGDGWTWVEVPVEGHGWVVVDPSPSEQDEIVEQELDELTAAEDQPEILEEDRSLVGVDPSQAIGSPPPVDAEEVPWWLVLVLVAVAPAALATTTIARRALRRRGRRSGSERRRVVGAWHEVLDAVYEAGVRDVEALAADEVADAVVGMAPWLGEPLLELAGLANRAVFSSWPIEPAEVGRAWAITWTVRRDLRRTAGLRSRLRALAAPPPVELNGELVRQA